MRHKLKITLFADATGREQETWYALLTYRGNDRWIPLKASWVEEAEFEITELLATAPRRHTDPQQLRWSLAPGASEPMEGQVAEAEVLDGFTLASVATQAHNHAAA